MMKVKIEVCDHPSKEVRSDIPSKYITSRARHTQDMIIVNEYGIYEALFASRRLEARKFRQWTWEVMQKLRRRVGLEGYEVMRMTEPEVQEEIDHILDTLFYDEKTRYGDAVSNSSRTEMLSKYHLYNY